MLKIYQFSKIQSNRGSYRGRSDLKYMKLQLFQCFGELQHFSRFAYWCIFSLFFDSLRTTLRSQKGSFVLIKYQLRYFFSFFAEISAFSPERSHFRVYRDQSRKKTPDARNVVTIIATATRIAIILAPLFSLFL